MRLDKEIKSTKESTLHREAIDLNFIKLFDDFNGCLTRCVGGGPKIMVLKPTLVGIITELMSKTCWKLWRGVLQFMAQGGMHKMGQYITYNGTLTVNTTHTLVHILQVQILLLHTEYWYTYYRILVHILHWYT